MPYFFGYSEIDSTANSENDYHDGPFAIDGELIQQHKEVPMGIAMLRKAGDKVLARLVPQVKAGACCPPDCFHRCVSGAKLLCCSDCACHIFCNGVGRC